MLCQLNFKMNLQIKFGKIQFSFLSGLKLTFYSKFRIFTRLKALVYIEIKGSGYFSEF